MAHRSAHRIKVVDGEERYQCSSCLEHKPRGDFSKAKGSALGIKSRCKVCLRRDRSARYWADADKEREQSRRYAAKRSARERQQRPSADRAYARALLESRRVFVDASVVVPWILESAEEGEGGLTGLSRRSGVTERALRALVNGHRPRCDMETADALALACSRQDDLSRAVLPTGADGWGPRGERSCSECGTCWHPHRAKGMCGKCYHRDYHGAGTPTRDVAWSRYHERCVSCSCTDKPHKSRGLCSPCYWRHRRAGTLDDFALDHARRSPAGQRG